MPATYDDAQLIMQILRWSTELGLPDAVREVLADDFDPDKVSTDDHSAGKVLGFGEVVGTFVKQGLLDRDLVFDMWWMEGLWARVGPVALRQRQHLGEPRIMENFEKLASGG